jgi:zinc protease
VRFGYGRFGLPKDKAVPSWAVGGALSGGGLSRLSNADLPKALTGKQASMSFGVGDEAFDLEGSTRTGDLETELQYLAAFLTDPAWRPEGLQRTLSGWETALKQASTTASGAFSLQHGLIVHNGDKRWTVPNIETVKSTQLDTVKAVIEQARSKGPLEVVIAGDVVVADTIEALKRTFGALAKREVDTKRQAGHEELPKDGMAPVVLRYSGASNEALAQLAWKTTGLYPELKTTRALNVLRAVMRQRLFDELRTKEGITYSPSVGLSSSKATEDWGYFSASSQVPSDKVSAFYSAVEKVVADLKEKEIPVDEFERARGPLVKDAEHSEETNSWWLAVTSGLQTDPRGIETIRDHVSGYKILTPADVLKVAQTYLKEERSFRILSAPEGAEIPAKLP